MNVLIVVPLIYQYLDETSLALLKLTNKELYETINVMIEHYGLHASKIKLSEICASIDLINKYAIQKFSIRTITYALLKYGSLETIKIFLNEHPNALLNDDSNGFEKIGAWHCNESDDRINSFLNNEPFNYLLSYSSRRLRNYYSNNYEYKKFHYRHSGVNLTNNPYMYAAQNSLEVLEYIISLGDEDWKLKKYCVCYAAAASGKLDCLMFAHKHKTECENMCAIAAASNGHIDCLKYLYELEYKNINNEIYLCKINNNASTINIFKCLQYLIEKGKQFNYTVINNLAEFGDLESIKLLRETESSINYNSLSYKDDPYPNVLSATNGHIDILKYFHKIGHPLSRDVCTGAALNGHLDCLKYAIDNGCPIDNNACDYAARNGHTKCLIYLYLHGGTFTTKTAQNAAFSGNLECVKYIFKKSALSKSNKLTDMLENQFTEANDNLFEICKRLKKGVSEKNNNLLNKLIEPTKSNLFNIVKCIEEIEYGHLECMEKYIQYTFEPRTDLSCELSKRIKYIYGKSFIYDYKSTEEPSYNPDVNYGLYKTKKIHCDHIKCLNFIEQNSK